jgi:hypothetical protein
MKRTSPYFDLKWRVDCKRPPNPATWWETIAAFNSDRVALAYAADCLKSKASWKEGPWEYRVMERRGSKWVEITKPSL